VTSTSKAQKTPETADAFEDARPVRPRRPSTPSSALSPAITIAIAALVLAVLISVTGWRVLLIGELALAVIVGALLERPALVRTAAAVAIAGVVGVLVGLDVPMTARLVVAVGFVVVAAGFVFLPRVLLGRAIRDARAVEQARADAEVLRLLDDAHHFRRLGGAESDDAATLKDVAGAVAQRDRLYRLLGLIERGLRTIDGVALYVVDDRSTHLRLVEQRHRVYDDVDADNHTSLALGARGVGPAGLLGLALQRKTPLRVVDSEGAAVRAHRRTGPPPQSALCVPLLAAGGSTATGVLIVDRVAAVAFTDDDEAFVCAAAAEVLDGLATEALFDALDAERRRTERVFAATRALAGVTRTVDVQRTAALAIGELCAGVAIVDVDAASSTFVVGHAAGILAALDGHRGALDASSFAARVLVEGVALPHTALERATPRALLGVDPVAVADLGDLRVVPLLAAGDAHGMIVVATRPGERLRKEVVDAVVAIADVFALALASARAFDAVERKATTDGLTGVWNRRTLDEKLVEAVARARRSGSPLCVMITDVDHFKSVNDTWGHATGDEVLKGVARSLQAQARTTDIVARLGGEEFVVVCEATDIAGATVVAERMRLALKALQFSTPKGPLSVTSSFGVARLLPDDSDGHPTLEHADKQLYKAKQQGRDRVVAD
jgi:two-component system cell cycle response regulator